MVNLIEISEENWPSFAGLSVADSQKKYLASNIGILARGYVYRNSRARVLGITADENPVGLALVRDLDEEPVCYELQQFMIDKDQQGKGYGSEALKLILDSLKKEHKYDCVEVCVKMEDVQAIHVYEKAGFVDTGYIDEDVPDSFNLVYRFGDDSNMRDYYEKLYKNGGYIKEMRKHIGHAPILTCACGVIIEDDDGEILLQRRRDNGCWAIIGGSMEMGETFEETVRRETMEESGLTLGKLEVFKLISGRDRIIEYPNGDVCFGPGIVFITKEYEGTIVNDPEEVMEQRFFKKNELPKNLNKFDKDIILDWAKR